VLPKTYIKKTDQEKCGRDEMGWEEEMREIRAEGEERKGRADEPSLRNILKQSYIIRWLTKLGDHKHHI